MDSNAGSLLRAKPACRFDATAQCCRYLSIWCGRRDSNSHTFRHYPLKIACLPISPRPLFSLLANYLDGMRNLAVFFAFQAVLEFTPKYGTVFKRQASKSRYFVGICAAPEAAGAAGTGTAALPVTGTEVPGICAAPDAAGSGFAGVVAALLSRTLVPVVGRAFPK